MPQHEQSSQGHQYDQQDGVRKTYSRRNAKKRYDFCRRPC
jgi:hypothetical protein